MLPLVLGICLVAADAVKFSAFDRPEEKFGLKPGESGVQTLSLPPLDPKIAWTEAIVSWNGIAPTGTQVVIKAKVSYADRETKAYTLAIWTNSKESRTSVNGQTDADGDVLTDTLAMKQPGGKLSVWFEYSSTERVSPRIDFASVVFSTSTSAAEDKPYKKAWGKIVDAPQRCQGDYPNGGVLCSPTSVSMILAHWSNVRGETALDSDVPEVAEGVYDVAWKGTGNWPFNVAFAGSKPGMVGYVTRLRSLNDLERWTEKGIPLACSVSYAMLKGGPNREDNDGHLVLLLGFDQDGNPVFNDPGRKAVRLTYKRSDFQRAWESSGRTVYVVYPRSVAPPRTSGAPWWLP